MIPLPSAVLDRLETLHQTWLYARRGHSMANLNAAESGLLNGLRNALPQLIQMGRAYQQIAAMRARIAAEITLWEEAANEGPDRAGSAHDIVTVKLLDAILALLPPPPAPSETP